MDAVERLIALGVEADTAKEICTWFLTQGDETGLEDYIGLCRDYMLRKEGTE